MIVYSDMSSKEKITNKAKKAKVHHSPIAEHFRGAFPLFVNRYHEGLNLREHEHEYLEIVYVMSGEGYHYVGDSVERTFKGCLYILPVGTSHILRPSDASGNRAPIVYNLCIRPEFIDVLKDGMARYDTRSEYWSIYAGKPGSHIAVVDKRMQFASAFEELYREYEESKPGYEACMFSILLQLTVQIARMAIYGGKLEDDARFRGHRITEISAILEYINEHLTESFTMEQLAKHIGLSRRHFIRLFHQRTGMRFAEYVQHRRIELACRMLLDTDHKIETIAKSTGYRDMTHFRQVFRRLMGTTPSQYRHNNK